MLLIKIKVQTMVNNIQGLYKKQHCLLYNWRYGKLTWFTVSQDIAGASILNRLYKYVSKTLKQEIQYF